VVTPTGKPNNTDGTNFYIRDGILIIPKGAVLESGSWI
jgi:glucose-1-phosphate adenylyltransferase